MNMLGMTSGIGSMMIAAKKQGFNILGNIEWRKYYHTGTFEFNFNAPMVSSIEEFQTNEIIDVLIGHPECGSYSPLNKNGIYSLENRSEEKMKEFLSDIPLFLNAVKKFNPKIFVFDEHPNSLKVASKEYYEEQLPDYKIDLIQVSNFNYGNVQKRRNRLFVLGSLKSLNYNFEHSEIKNEKRVKDVLQNLDGLPNHIIPCETEFARGWSDFHIGKDSKNGKITIKELKEFMKNIKFKSNVVVTNSSGKPSERFGYTRLDPDYFSPVLFKEESLYHWTGRPLTIRERARIQGCPDDFIFKPECAYSDPNHPKLIKQTGKFMPVEFCTHLTQHIKDFLEELK